MAKKKSSFEIDSAFGTYAKDAKIDAVTDKVIDSLNAEIKPKPLHFYAPVGATGCEQDTYLYNRTTDPKPTPGIPYPDPGETGICDVEISKTRWAAARTIIITLSVTGVVAYAIHAAYLIKLAIR